MLGEIELEQMLAADYSTQHRMVAGLALLAQQLHRLRRHVVGSNEAGALAVKCPENSIETVAEPNRLIKYRVEYWREIAGRGIDNLQYFRCCRLLFQCLPRFVDQPRILHRNDRLRREILQQSDLLVGE